jgi:pimeloyl-ACP methyl ester carboxylesterase
MSTQKRTIVRSIRRHGRHAGGRALTRLGGARYAEQLWFRLPDVPSSESRERRTPVGGTSFTLRSTTSAGQELAVSGRVYGPEGLPVAYLVHGWGGWWQQLGALVMPLVESGFRVVAYDAPSQGGSPPGRYGPRSTTVVEMAEAFAAVVTEYGPAGVVVAHSLGAVATTWARGLGVQPRGYVLIAPVVSVEPLVDRFGRVLGLGGRQRAEFAQRLERRIGLPMGDFDLVALARDAGVQLPPMLAVHDRSDTESPADRSVALVDAWPAGELVLTEGLGHRKLLGEPDVVRAAVAFAQEAAGAQPIRSMTRGGWSGREPAGATV